MAFNSKKIMQFVRSNYPNVGSTAQSSLGSDLARLSSSTTPKEVFDVVNKKLHASGYYSVRESDVLRQWKQSGAVQ